MPMSDKELAIWQQQGNRSVRATPTDTVGDASKTTICLGAMMLLISMVLGIAGWTALLVMLFG